MLAYTLDYEALPRDFLKGHGERVYGYYGLDQWMAVEMKQRLEKMQPYKLDLDKATKLRNRMGGYIIWMVRPTIPMQGFATSKLAIPWCLLAW